MKISAAGHLKTIIDREKLMRLKPCPACGQYFNLGVPVLLAVCDWDGPPRLIHEFDAIFDLGTAMFFGRRCYEAKKRS